MCVFETLKVILSSTILFWNIIHICQWLLKQSKWLLLTISRKFWLILTILTFLLACAERHMRLQEAFPLIYSK